MLKVILFDFDGIIVNIEFLYYKIWKEILKDYGVEIDFKFYK